MVLMFGSFADEVLGTAKASATAAMIKYGKRDCVGMKNFAGRGNGKIITFFKWSFRKGEYWPYWTVFSCGSHPPFRKKVGLIGLETWC